MQYKKLVRDKIPDIIAKVGKTPVTHTASNEEYEQKLLEKLQEEIDEYMSNNDEEELADMLEVIYAIADFKGLTPLKIEEIRKNKETERGGFKQKIILDEVK